MRSLAAKLNSKIELFILFSYGIIGALSVLINFISFAFLYDALGIYYKIAATISYTLSVIFNFTLNRYFTFSSSGSYLLKHMSKYLTMIGVNYLITMCILHVCVESLGLSPYFGLISAISITAITGFLLSKRWVYRQNI